MIETKPTGCLLCTDLDRTLIPNGKALEHPQARAAFRQFCDAPEVTLAYVSGRHLDLVKSAIADYHLPVPDYAITDVGSQIYQALPQGGWQVLADWDALIAQDWRQQSSAEILALLAPLLDQHLALRLQEADKQNRYKLSFYLPMAHNPDPVMQQAQALLSASDIQASLIWSLDEAQGLGLLDILPKQATKFHAIQFLQHRLGFRQDEVVFAGDSGNDLPVLVSDFQSVLVANASLAIQQQATLLAQHNGHAPFLYLAQNRAPSQTNGHYAAGILQGVAHFMPSFAPAQIALKEVQIDESAPKASLTS